MARAARIAVQLVVLFVFFGYPFCELDQRKNNALSRLQGRFTPPCATRKHGVEFNIYYDLGQFNLLFC